MRRVVQTVKDSEGRVDEEEEVEEESEDEFEDEEGRRRDRRRWEMVILRLVVDATCEESYCDVRLRANPRAHPSCDSSCLVDVCVTISS